MSGINFLTMGLLRKILFIKEGLLKLMSGNTWWSTIVGTKLLSDLVIFSIFPSDLPLDFQESIRLVPLKNFMYFFSWCKY